MVAGNDRGSGRGPHNGPGAGRATVPSISYATDWGALMYKHILIPTDGSGLSEKAIAHGLKLARSVRAKVTFITVTEPFHTFVFSPEQITETPAEYRTHMREQAARFLAEAGRLAEAEGIAHDTVQIEEQHPYQAIIDTATGHECDLIVMSSHGRSGVSAMLLGSETLKVLTHTTIPVLVCR